MPKGIYKRGLPTEKQKKYWRSKKGISPKTAFKKGHPKPKNAYKWEKGHKCYREKGYKLSEEHKNKIRIANRISQIGLHTGSKSNFWNGGTSYEPYSVDWKKTLKRSIRERQHYICGMCGLPQEDIALDVHHIDYNKKNCNPDNLIALHHKCHARTNFNRHYWEQYFTNHLQWKI